MARGRRQGIPRTRAAIFAGIATAAVLAVPGVASAAVNTGVDNGELTVTSTAGDDIKITCTIEGKVDINGGKPDTGAADCADITSIVVNGGPDANDINLAGVTIATFDHLTTVTIDGNGGNDTIRGSEVVDTLNGGAGNDRISGDDNAAGTRDEFNGDAGDDTLVWNPGDDDDLIEGGEGTDTIEVNGGGGGEQFTIKPSATAGRVVFDRTGPTPPGPFNLDIGSSEKLDLNANGGDDTLDTAVGALATALDIDGGAGNDTLDGGDGADRITGGEGNDRLIGDDNPAATDDDVQGGAGDDTMVWNPGDDDDINDGGDGVDTVEVNGGGDEQFTIKPSATPGRIEFDRVNAPFNVDIGTSEKFDVNAGAGVDSLVTAGGDLGGMSLDVDGGPGNDTLDGSDGADKITGGDGNDRLVGDDNPAGTRDDVRGDAGDDTLVWNPGDDDDLNEGGAGNDTAEVNGGNGGEQFAIDRSDVPGRVLFDRTGPSPTPGPFNVDIGTSERIDLNANGGDDTLTTTGAELPLTLDVDGGAGNDIIRGSRGTDVLAGGDGNDLIRSKDKARDDVSCGAGVDLARVDPRDVARDCDIVVGGALKVRLAGKPVVRGKVALLRLRCVNTDTCKGAVLLQGNGKKLGSGRFAIGDGRTKLVRVKLNRRGRHLVAGAGAKGVRASLRIDSRDSAGNGWRVNAHTRLKA